MTPADHLSTYAEGWTKGDSEIILSATAESFVFDDPNAGRIAKPDFAAYVADLKGIVAELRGGTPADNFMDLSEVITSETDGKLSAWCWWAIPGTDLQGSGLIKVGPEGVEFERITYYTKLPG